VVTEDSHGSVGLATDPYLPLDRPPRSVEFQFVRGWFPGSEAVLADPFRHLPRLSGPVVIRRNASFATVAGAAPDSNRLPNYPSGQTAEGHLEHGDLITGSNCRPYENDIGRTQRRQLSSCSAGMAPTGLCGGQATLRRPCLSSASLGPMKRAYQSTNCIGPSSCTAE
jgi:hypothetical protein